MYSKFLNTEYTLNKRVERLPLLGTKSPFPHLLLIITDNGNILSMIFENLHKDDV